MTYLEIIEWIEKYAMSKMLCLNGLYRLAYEDDNGQDSLCGKDLISIVLEINNKQLIK
jgi:hypothetical protein